MKRIKRERMITQRNMGVGLLKGAIWSMLVTAAGTALMASLILNETLRETAIGYTAMGILLLSALAGSVAAVRAVGKQLVLTAMLSGLIYFGILAALNAMLYKGGFEGIGVTALVILAGVGVTILMGVNDRGGKRKIRV